MLVSWPEKGSRSDPAWCLQEPDLLPSLPAGPARGRAPRGVGRGQRPRAAAGSTAALHCVPAQPVWGDAYRTPRPPGTPSPPLAPTLTLTPGTQARAPTPTPHSTQAAGPRQALSYSHGGRRHPFSTHLRWLPFQKYACWWRGP